MHTRIRLGLSAATGLMAAGLLALAILAPAPVAGAAPGAVTDAVGDTVTEAVEDPITAPRGDIVVTTAEPRPEGIALSVRVGQLVDPMADPNWSSDASYVTWSLDVTGDNKRDYEIEYSIDPETRGLAAFLYPFGSTPRPPDNCEPHASFSAEAGYSVVLDRKCIGNPSALSYKVESYYDTDAKKDSAEIATDVSPNQGWSGPVGITATSGTPMAPQTAPQPAGPGAAPQTPSVAPAPTPQGSSAAPAPAGATPTQAGAPGRAPRASARPDPSPVPPVAPAVPATGLAKTGPIRAVQMAEIAGALVLAGLSLMLASRRRPVPAGCDTP